jgi:uncharacterized integral membrane protein
MRYLFWLLSFVLLAFFLTFAVKNSDPVAVRYFLGYEWRAPLILVLLAFFCIGAALGVLATFTKIMRLRRQIAGLRRELRAQTAPVQEPPPPDLVPM